MERSAGLSDWRVTRLLLAAGAFATATGLVALLQGPSANVAWLLLVVGFALVVASTGGLAHDDAAGRIRSDLGARVRPSASTIACLPITLRTPRGVSPPRA